MTRLYLHPLMSLVGVGHFGFTILMNIVSPMDFIIMSRLFLDGLFYSLILRQRFVTGAWLLIAQSHLFLNLHVCRFRLRCGKTSSKGVPAIHPIVITNRYQLGRLYLYTAKLSSFGMICVSNT